MLTEIGVYGIPICNYRTRKRGIDLYNITAGKTEKVESTTFSALNMVESEIEEVLRSNIDMICEEDESALIVGKQVVNTARGISDLTAIDHNGNIVLIEIQEMI